MEAEFAYMPYTPYVAVIKAGQDCVYAAYSTLALDFTSPYCVYAARSTRFFVSVFKAVDACRACHRLFSWPSC